MKSNFFCHRIPALIVAAGLCLTTLQGMSYAGGWFLPLKYPAGENHRYYAIGLSTPVLEPGVKMTTMSDGSHIFAINAENGHGHIYLWDRISGQYNCPVLASTDARFKTYATMNRDNMVFTKNVYYQLRQLWGKGSTPQQSMLMTKLYGAVARDSDRIF